jgi:predicted short-subunit dehydrogenase-like oxidoreductase (DUF2520 family)
VADLESGFSRTSARIAIVGTGAVARALGRALHAGGAPVAAISGRSIDAARGVAASIAPAVRAVPLAELPGVTTHVIVATTDSAIPVVATRLAASGLGTGSTVVHTCGGCPPDALATLQAAGAACGVFHPLQTIVGDAEPMTLFRGITCVVAGDRSAVEWGGELARCLGANAVSVPVERLPVYHAGAVLASNGIVAVVDAAVALLERAGFEHLAALHALEPLTRAAVDNVFRLGPERALTGPVARGDVTTLARHLTALNGTPGHVDALYRAVSSHLTAIAGRGAIDAATARELTAALEANKPPKQ